MFKFKEIREKNNLTKTQVAQMLNVRKETYGKWENEVEQMPTRRVFEFSNLFNINIDYLLGLTNIKIFKKGQYTIDLKKIGLHTRELRIELGLTLIEIANILSIEDSTWSRYETGKFLIQSSYLVAISKKAGISADYVLGKSKVKYLKDLE